LTTWMCLAIFVPSPVILTLTVSPDVSVNICALKQFGLIWLLKPFGDGCISKLEFSSAVNSLILNKLGSSEECWLISRHAESEREKWSFT
jgi:hypothetical protein